VTTVVYIGGPEAEAAATEFRAAGLDARVLGGDQAEELARADAEGVRYALVHVGLDDGVPGGSFERAHHRVPLGQVPSLAERLRPRGRPLVTCLAFAYKNGLPEEATWLVDVRFLDNPYWVPELRDLTGRDAAVSDFVLRQPAAAELMDRLESALRWAIPLYQRDHITVAFGCTGGRHRSVALAAEMARRLAEVDSVDVEFLTRDL
jgi:RapZ C-terminal domain